MKQFIESHIVEWNNKLQICATKLANKRLCSSYKLKNVPADRQLYVNWWIAICIIILIIKFWDNNRFFSYTLIHSYIHQNIEHYLLFVLFFVGLYMHIILKCERIREGHRKDIGKHWGENTAGGFVVYDIMFKFLLIMKMQIFAFVFYWYLAINSYVGACSDSPNEKRSIKALSLPFK